MKQIDRVRGGQRQIQRTGVCILKIKMLLIFPTEFEETASAILPSPKVCLFLSETVLFCFFDT